MSVQELDAILKSGQRTNRGRLLLTLPGGVAGNTDTLRVLCQSATVPGKTRGAITLQRLGKTARIAGDSLTDETFTVMVQVPKDAKIVYDTFHQWFTLGDNSEGYKSTARYDSLALDNTISASWNMKGIWPSVLPPVNFDATAQDTITEFEVTFTIDEVELI